MNKVFIIFRKEMLDILRDRRTLLVMILIPLLVFPLLMNVATRIMISQKKKAEAKVITLGLLDRGNATDFQQLLENRSDLVVKKKFSTEEIPELIQKGSLDFALVFEADFDIKIKNNRMAQIELFMKSSDETSITRQRIDEILRIFEDRIITRRFETMNIDKSITEAFRVRERDVASIKQKIGEAIGGFLPYIFVIFCFIGAMYPAIDLGAGEKERGTIETLLTSPTRRIHIVLGKFMVVFFAGITSAAVSVLGLYLSIRQSREIPKEFLSSLLKIIDAKSIALVFSLLIPLCIFFAAILLSISIFAHSFKEAQSIMTPLNFIVIFPVFVGLFPGIDLNAATALIPVLNVSLATREIISGTIHLPFLLLAYVSLFGVAALGLYFCVRWFQRENVIFRES